MFNEDPLVVAFCVVTAAAIFAVVIPGAIWLVIHYLEFLSWAGKL